MSVFGKQNPNQPLSQRSVLEYKYNNSRWNILLVVVFTAINLVLLFADGSSYFLFSASVPYFLTGYGLFLGGKFPTEIYEEIVPEGYELLPADNGIVIGIISVAALIVVVYLLCWIFSRKQRVGWIITALVLFSIDTVALVILGGIDTDAIFDILFHVWVIVDLARGIAAYCKLKKLPVTEVTAEGYENISEVVAENPYNGTDYASDNFAPIPASENYTDNVENSIVENNAENISENFNEYESQTFADENEIAGETLPDSAEENYDENVTDEDRDTSDNADESDNIEENEETETEVDDGENNKCIDQYSDAANNKKTIEINDDANFI